MNDRPDIALVTGAARGIGAAIAAALEETRWRVVRIDVSYAPGDPMNRAVDVTDYDAVAAMVNDIESGLGPIGGLVNNAGITRDGFFHRLDPRTQWDPVIAVNLTAPFHMCRAVIPGMRERRFGRILSMSSMNGIKGQAAQANYAAAKAGLIAMTKTLALETAPLGITANCIAPGFIDTEMTRAIRPDIRELEMAKIPAGRFGTPEEVAAVAAFLMSDAAAFMTGETVSLNGGQLMA
ncbi:MULTISPECIES: 3-oxoacyl-ACP reductase FabG [unclassified Chelatococcus]|uniref:3-oxoacyl-ACP reductase FabG n=1 Tax=unclassified Chelatococcus TaxID=2638111 RepID=UPI001BCF3337|nr:MULTISPECIES: 3-oxoacyl-ACP reductase FabG [unclassified Chelatococcus]MBS7743449.1 3-oxoacyl-ACP reductase FabG [Chelatococcus sp. HY11]MBX3547111.1 3-oxoacyl-ACP reductase FabG [Chelatococcus sp.]CAH1663762.1 Acetoacetyl-CoA reductase [Hyphomicrobiales bacterium]CAH1687885.1 Acetoacetyl-CoA reductase [Hyphomicrobiales bacterium]